LIPCWMGAPYAVAAALLMSPLRLAPLLLVHFEVFTALPVLALALGRKFWERLQQAPADRSRRGGGWRSVGDGVGDECSR
jgi:membrane protein implicated in regulation of membrane protease activity